MNAWRPQASAEVPVNPDTLQWHLLGGQEEWSRITDVVRRIMTLLREWDQERARLARERQEEAERAEPELAAARDAARIASRRAANDRRNASRRDTRARERAERERLNPTQSPSPVTAARRAAVAQRVREHRDRNPRAGNRRPGIRRSRTRSRSRSRSRRRSRSQTMTDTDGGSTVMAAPRLDPIGRTRASRRPTVQHPVGAGAPFRGQSSPVRTALNLAILRRLVAGVFGAERQKEAVAGSPTVPFRSRSRPAGNPPLADEASRDSLSPAEAAAATEATTSGR
ncbi:reverse transcriptase [Anopheles sinensis]|uniref:Reverse transcriptase n=1 Tax=Anopheles sinensis TaxID=74873 RepID=A0A084WUX8_ANOSI|nr:reverse transcriptase [Anopheles sinensis]